MIGCYNYTVILTYLGFASALLGIFSSMAGHPGTAIFCLMISGLCDMFDGLVARTMERTDKEKKFGIQIDSLSDLVCFGVLPATIGYAIGIHSYFGIALFVYPLAALIRLAYFNIMEEERQQNTTEARKVYEGLPVTSAALIMPFVYILKRSWVQRSRIIYAVVLICVAVAFLIKFHLKKAGLKGMLLMIVVGILELMWLIFKKSPMVIEKVQTRESV